MSVNFSAGTGLLIAGVFLLLLIIPGFTDIISDLFNRQVRSVWRSSTKYALAFSGVFLVAIGLAIILKAEVPESPTQAQLPTETGITISTPTTAFVCGSGAIPAISTPQPIIPEPTLVVVMVDESTTKEALEIVLSSLDESLRAGDRIIVIVGGEQTYDKAKLADERVQSIAPLIITPSPPPLSTSTPVIVVTSSGTILQRQIATQTAEAAFMLATQTAIQYSCSVYEWNLSYQNNYSQWEAESKRLVSASISNLEQRIQNYGIVKPSNNGVFESLSLISNIFDVECTNGNFKKCVFVPIAKMVDERIQQPPSDIQVNLNHIQIVGTISNCPLYNQECQDRANYWKEYLQYNGAYAQFVNLDDLESILAAVMRR